MRSALIPPLYKGICEDKNDSRIILKTVGGLKALELHLFESTYFGVEDSNVCLKGSFRAFGLAIFTTNHKTLIHRVYAYELLKPWETC